MTSLVGARQNGDNPRKGRMRAQACGRATAGRGRDGVEHARRAVPGVRAGAARSAARAPADGLLAGLAYRAGLFRGGVSRHDLRRASPGNRPCRPRRLGAGQAVGDGVGDPVRHRRGLRNGPQLRNGLVVAGADGSLRRRARLAVRLRRALVLHRSDLPGHLPLRMGPHAAAQCSSRWASRGWSAHFAWSASTRG
jgi:hypothetical protein